MRANDEVTADYIQSLETDNDHLRMEIVVLKEEIKRLEIEYRLMKCDREYA